MSRVTCLAFCLVFTSLALPSFAAPPPATVCKPGMSVSEDTGGHCCWPGQAWSKSRQKCLGVPVRCPSGMVADGSVDQCVSQSGSAPQAAPGQAKAAPVCANGQAIGPDTDGHCCWSGQVWQQRCVGRPSACPQGWAAKEEQCVESPCEPGLERTAASTGGRCCWPGQAWSKSRNACVGTPARCPQGMKVDADAEVCRPVTPRNAEENKKTAATAQCPPGQTVTPDTAGRCCPPDNRWSAIRAACVAKRRPPPPAAP